MTDLIHDLPHRQITRQRVIRSAKTFFWVAIVTVLIWVYADLEKTETDTYHTKVVLNLPASSDLVFASGADLKRQEIEVTFRASGSRSGLDLCRRKLAAQAETVVEDLSARSAGRQPVEIAEVVRRTEAVREAGLTVVSAAPGVVEVDLDRSLRVSGVEVKFRYSGAGLVEASPQPSTVSLRVAPGRWEELTKELARSGQRPVIETAVVNLQTLPADANKPIRVDLVPFVSGVPVLPDRPAVDVELKISQASIEKKLAVPVRIQTPPTWDEDDTWQRFVLKRENPLDWQKEITFRGPQKEIEKLRPEDLDAYVVLREDDKAKTESWLPHPVEIRLPLDTKIQVVPPKPVLNLRLEPRVPGAATP